MTSNPRLMLQFAAATGIAAMLWVAAPAMAADSAANSDVPAIGSDRAPGWRRAMLLSSAMLAAAR